MSSAKILHSSIIVCLLLLFISCSSEPDPNKKFKRTDLETTPLFLYFAIGTLNEAPVSSVECWNREALKEIGVRSIVLYSKGGKNPDDTLEKITFDYSDKWHTLDYKGFKFDEAPNAWTIGVLSVPEKNQTGQVLFSRHFGIDKQLKTIVQPIENGYLFLRSKTGNRYDSTWVIGTLTRPKAIVSKIGKSVFSIEIYLPEGSSTKDIIRRFKKLPVVKGNIQAAQCSVIFTSSGRPQRAFLLNDQFSQVAKIREWTYTSTGNIATYQEWMGSALTKDMSWHYEGKSQLPDYTVIDRNTYFYRYE